MITDEQVRPSAHRTHPGTAQLDALWYRFSPQSSWLLFGAWPELEGCERSKYVADCVNDFDRIEVHWISSSVYGPTV